MWDARWHISLSETGTSCLIKSIQTSSAHPWVCRLHWDLGVYLSGSKCQQLSVYPLRCQYIIILLYYYSPCPFCRLLNSKQTRDTLVTLLFILVLPQPIHRADKSSPELTVSCFSPDIHTCKEHLWLPNCVTIPTPLIPHTHARYTIVFKMNILPNQKK